MISKIITDIINSSIIFLNLLKKNWIFLTASSLFGLLLGVYLENYNFKKKIINQGFSEINFEFFDKFYSSLISKNNSKVNIINDFSDLSERFNNEFNSKKINEVGFYDEYIYIYCIKDKKKNIDNYLNLSTDDSTLNKKINLIIRNHSKSEVETCFNYIQKIFHSKKNKFIDEEIKKIDALILHLTKMNLFFNEKAIINNKDYKNFYDYYSDFYDAVINFKTYNNKLFQKEDQRSKEYFISLLLNSEKNILYPYVLYKDEKNSQIYLKRIDYSDLIPAGKSEKKISIEVELIPINEFLKNNEYFINVTLLKSSFSINIEKRINLLKFYKNLINEAPFMNIKFSELIMSESLIKSTNVPLISFLSFLIIGIFLIYFKNFTLRINK